MYMSYLSHLNSDHLYPHLKASPKALNSDYRDLPTPNWMIWTDQERTILFWVKLPAAVS